MANSLFAYGTLMCQNIMLKVTGCCPACYQGILRGYSRRSIKGKVYPALIPEEKSTVDGLLYQRIPDEAWDLLDQFEGEMYSRRSVEITLPDKTVIPAETYVIRPEFLHIIQEKEWDFDNFLFRHKNSFLAKL